MSDVAEALDAEEDRPAHKPAAVFLRALFKQWIGMMLMWPLLLIIPILGVQLCFATVTLYLLIKAWFEGLDRAWLGWKLFTIAMMGIHLRVMWVLVESRFWET